MSDFVRVVATSELVAKTYCRFINRKFIYIVRETIPACRPRQVEGGFVDVPEQICGWKKHPTLSRWYVGPIPRAFATFLHGRTVTLRNGQEVVPDFTEGTNTFDLDDIEAEFQTSLEAAETRD